MCGSELTALPDGVQRVAAALQEKGHPHGPRMLDNPPAPHRKPRTPWALPWGNCQEHHLPAQEAMTWPCWWLPRATALDEKKVEAHVGKVGRADADFVKSRTGFSIGGVSPVAHATPPVTLIDQGVLRFDVVWAAAGHPDMACSRCTPATCSA